MIETRNGNINSSSNIGVKIVKIEPNIPNVEEDSGSFSTTSKPFRRLLKVNQTDRKFGYWFTKEVTVDSQVEDDIEENSPDIFSNAKRISQTKENFENLDYLAEAFESSQKKRKLSQEEREFKHTNNHNNSQILTIIGKNSRSILNAESSLGKLCSPPLLNLSLKKQTNRHSSVYIKEENEELSNSHKKIRKTPYPSLKSSSLEENSSPSLHSREIHTEDKLKNASKTSNNANISNTEIPFLSKRKSKQNLSLLDSMTPTQIVQPFPLHLSSLPFSEFSFSSEESFVESTQSFDPKQMKERANITSSLFTNASRKLLKSESISPIPHTYIPDSQVSEKSQFIHNLDSSFLNKTPQIPPLLTPPERNSSTINESPSKSKSKKSKKSIQPHKSSQSFYFHARKKQSPPRTKSLQRNTL